MTAIDLGVAVPYGLNGTGVVAIVGAKSDRYGVGVLR